VAAEAETRSCDFFEALNPAASRSAIARPLEECGHWRMSLLTMMKSISVVTCVTLLRAHVRKLDNTPSFKLPLERLSSQKDLVSARGWPPRRSYHSLLILLQNIMPLFRLQRQNLLSF
jgi:hypothetical protein